MDRSVKRSARALRGSALGFMLGAIAVAGCNNDGYEGKEFGQDFEKPADYPTKSVEEPDIFPGDEGGEESPRERRAAGAKAEG